MAQITDYDSLKTTIATWLNRDDLMDDIPNFIQNAEARLNRDKRVRKLVEIAPFTTGDEDATSLPSDFDSIEALYHDGPTYFGEIEIVGAEMLGDFKARLGATGVPAYGAIVNRAIRWAPVPNAAFSLKLTYFANLALLSDSNTSNWLLDDHPDIYLYASLVESAPFLREDDRLIVWETELEKRLERLHESTERAQYSGTLTRQIPRPLD